MRPMRARSVTGGRGRGRGGEAGWESFNISSQWLL